MKHEEGPLEERLKGWTASNPAPELSPQAIDSIANNIKDSLTPVRPLPGRRILVMTFLAVTIVLAGSSAVLLGKDGLMMMTRMQIAGMAVILGAGAVLFAVALSGEMIPGSRQLLSLPALAGLTLIGVSGIFAALFPWKAQPGFVSEGWPCAALEMTIVVPSALIFLAIARRGVLLVSSAAGAVITGLSVFLALIPLQTQCMFLEAPHLIVWHGGTAVLAVALGALTPRFLHQN